MAVKFTELESQCRQIINDVKNGNFVPVYLLMGTEPYYPDLVCDEIMKYALADSERDFNQTVFYGLDTDAGTVASECRSYPMMAERRLVVVKEAQSMKTLEDLATYASDPMESTVLVILMHGASADKRRALYKNVQKKGVVLVSDALRDYEMPQWITSFYKFRGLDIEPAAAALLAEYAGTDMSRIMLETEKMQKNLPEGTVRVNAADIEKNVGISRQFSIFELTKALSYMKAEKALKIAAYIGNGPKFMLLLATAPLYTHFYRILKYEAALLKNPAMSKSDRAKLLGVNPYFMEEYDVAARNYPIRRCMKVISLLEEYDFKGKGGGSGEASQGDLLMELVSKILS